MSLEALTRKSALAEVAAALHEAGLSRFTAAIELPADAAHGAPVAAAALGQAPDLAPLLARGAALAPPAPSELADGGALRLVSVGLWPHGAPAAALLLGLDKQAPVPPALRLLADAQGEAEALWDLAEQAESLRERAPSAQELAALRERVLQRLWHELLTPVALLRAAHEQLRATETDEKKLRPLRRIGTAAERLGHLFDLLNDILWAREAQPVRRSAAQLAEGLVMQAGAQLFNDLTSAGMTDDAAPLRAAALRLVDHARALVPLLEEPAVPVDLRGALKGVLEETARTAGQRRIEARLDAAGRETLPPRLLEQTVGALLKNAYAHTPDGSRIELRAVREGAGLCVEIQDHGVGIAPVRLQALMAGLSEARDPTWYSTGKPFAFGAGGAGLDLVRLQALGSWRGWRIEAESSLCPHVDAESRGCPGDAEKCEKLAAPADCAALAKGTLVRLRIPL